MVVMIIRCSECGKEGGLPFKIYWDYDTEYCDKCHHHQTQTKQYNFCSDKCMKKFVNRFTGHKHKWVDNWGKKRKVKNPMLDVPTLMMEHCKICGLGRWQKK